MYFFLHWRFHILLPPMTPERKREKFRLLGDFLFLLKMYFNMPFCQSEFTFSNSITYGISSELLTFAGFQISRLFSLGSVVDEHYDWRNLNLEDKAISCNCKPGWVTKKWQIRIVTWMHIIFIQYHSINTHNVLTHQSITGSYVCSHLPLKFYICHQFHSGSVHSFAVDWRVNFYCRK